MGQEEGEERVQIFWSHLLCNAALEILTFWISTRLIIAFFGLGWKQFHSENEDILGFTSVDNDDVPDDDNDVNNDGDDDELFLYNGWPTKGVHPYLQSEPLLEVPTIETSNKPQAGFEPAHNLTPGQGRRTTSHIGDQEKFLKNAKRGKSNTLAW